MSCYFVDGVLAEGESMTKSLMVCVLAVAVAGMSGCVTSGDGGTGGRNSSMPCIDGVCKIPADVKSGIRLKILGKEASLSDGVALRVIISNRGLSPEILTVCPAMTLCCVKGLHPMVAYDGTGMGLLDVCKSKKPKKHETFLPAGADFSFNVTIPPDCLPAECLKKGKQIKVKFCYDCEDDVQVDSNELTVTLK
jgi:hypothetical protein